MRTERKGKKNGGKSPIKQSGRVLFIVLKMGRGRGKKGN